MATQILTALTALTSIDGRYRKTVEPLAKHMSEFGLIKYRLVAMVEHLIALCDTPGVEIRDLSEADVDFLRNIPRFLTEDDAAIVKLIETEGYDQFSRTNHDVKACEYFLRLRLEDTPLRHLIEWIHFACTSEDVNNVAYSLMLKRAFDDILEPAIAAIDTSLHRLATTHADLSMLGRTHGQPASSTTTGKEFNNFRTRASKQLAKLREHRFEVKWNGASGNYNAHYAAFPDVDWIQYSRDYVKRINQEYRTNFKANLVTTQIEPHDSWAEFFGMLALLNTILIGFDQDVWRYVSDDWFVQKAVEGAVGSSAMPHKVNPIDFENAEGNLGVVNALLEFFSRKLPISRLQRDLSDSTVERNFGPAFGHCLVAYSSIMKGLGKIAPNEAAILKALDAHPEILTEAYQTILRSVGYPDPYSLMKGVARGKQLTIEDYHAVIGSLDVADGVKERMFAITPQGYTGIASRLARM